MKSEVLFGHFSIAFPDHSQNTFVIFENLADFFGTALQADAVKLLKKELAAQSLKPKPSIDVENDFTHIESKSADTIFSVAKVIHGLTVDEKRKDISEAKTLTVAKALKAWKKPAKQKWKLGDVFAIPLENKTYCFGQILGTHLTKTSPICALVDLNSEMVTTTFETLSKCRILSVWNCDSDELDSHEYKVVMNTELLANPDQVKNPKRSGGASFQTLANAFYGLAPWNVMHKEDYYDDFFLEEIKRPENIIWLSAEERIRYRKEKFNLD